MWDISFTDNQGVTWDVHKWIQSKVEQVDDNPNLGGWDYYLKRKEE